MKKYIKPAIVEVTIDTQDILQTSGANVNTPNNKVGNGSVLSKTGIWDDED